MKPKLAKILYTSILWSTLLFTGCYSWWQEKIDINQENSTSSLSDFLYDAPKISELSVPEQLIVSQGMYSGIVKLHWTDVPYASSYRIERAVVVPDSNGNYITPEDSDFSVLEKYVFNTNFNDHILTDPKTDSDYSNHYYYRVSAENIAKGYESSDFTTIGEGWLLAPPKNISAWKGKSTDSIQVSWDKVEKATGYQIYRSEKSNGRGMELLDTVKANQNIYLNTLEQSERGVDFYYKVVAVLSDSSLSAPTELTLGYSKMEGVPDAPATVTVQNPNGESTSSLSISWDSIENKEGYTTLYSVYRSSSTNSTLKQIKKEITNTSISDTNDLETGVIYYYYVQTIYKNDSSFLKSELSDTGPEPESSESQTAYGYLLSPPSDIDVMDGDSSDNLIIRWTPAVRYTKNQETDPYTYKILSCDTQNGSFTLLKTITELPVLTDGYYSLKVEKKNFYKVITVNPAINLESQASYVAAPTPNAPSSVYATKTSSLGDISKYSANSNEVYPVEITWTAPASDTPSGYHVYRSTNPDSGFRRISEEIIPVTQNSFIDENETARPGTYYYYKVISLNVLGQGNKGTIDYGYGAITRDQWFREYNKTIMFSQSKLTLMHKSNDMDKLGSETINGDISGTLSYNAAVAGLGAEIKMPYTNYADFYINNNASNGVYFLINGNTDTTSNMSGNGNMSGTVNCSGMYPGSAVYDNLQIKNKKAGGGYYLVKTFDLAGNEILNQGQVDWKVGEEGK